LFEPRLTPTFSLAAQQTFAAGAGPDAVAVGDFNNDGRPDFVVLNSTDGTASVYLNTTPAGSATPSFAAPQTFAAGSNPQSVAVADINGDGKPDLVVGTLGGSVSVLLNTTALGATTPSFAAAHAFSVGNACLGVAVGDFNGDGRPDLVTADGTDNNVVVLLNTTPAGSGSPSFAARETFAVGTGPGAVVVADFNNDGRPDIATANFSDNTVSVLLNTTTAGATNASFAGQQTFAVGTGPERILAADLTLDGRPDLIVTNDGSANVSVLLNVTKAGATTPAFAGQLTFGVGAAPRGVTVGDLDGDGKPDLAVTNSGDNTVTVLLSSQKSGGKGFLFPDHQTFAVGTTPESVAVADFNGDGRPDLVTANFVGTAGASLLANTTDPFGYAVPSVVGQFGSTGVWEFNRTLNNWVQLTPSNARLLATDAHGDVAADFPGYGVELYRPGIGWMPINGVDASALAINASGDIVAEFPGYGVGLYLPAEGWSSLTAANASALAIDPLGDVVGMFPGYGVWLFRPAAGWKQINGVDATSVAMDANGGVAANFTGYGVGQYTAVGGWHIVNGHTATALTFDAYGDLIAAIPGAGVGEFFPTGGGRLLTAANAARLAADGRGEDFGAFAGYGVWEYDPYRGWYQIRTSDASVLVVA
jgi:hypothetical protein